MIKEEGISGRQLFTLIFMAQIGLEVLSLPHAEASIAGHDSWIAVLLSGLTAQIGIILIWWLGSRYPARNFFAYTSSIIGRPLGACINLIYGCYYTLSGYLLIMLYVELLSRWLFILTPKWVLILMLLIVTGYAATSSLLKLANLTQSFMLLPVIGFLLIGFSGLYGMDARNLLPILPNGWSPVMKGVYTAFTAYVGYDLLLYAYPYVKTKSKKKLLLAMTLANACTIIYYVAVSLICSTMFSLKQLTLIPEPIVFILKNYRIEILQSIDILFLIFYLCMVSDTVYVYFFMAAKAFMHLRGRGLGKQKVWVLVITGACFIGSFFLKRSSAINRLATIQDLLSVFMIVALPIILLIISGLRGVGRSKT
ncbi:GerAB/ArcD/ProY family transporter [Paenibacillus lignilyticus]|uniref:GerAB/ArcD/ProY family transporter n=1 Tax=Paenibacillus lignilyticus TaxID=1172615 RepID=A0ABS5CJ58_9BACL|nr:GerAB/ArcD/ProY family transporter [Paenibacillus lignilyticus]MBP3965857.1 GerAB/ArcD/ProY family transporter [Paenibacillus lignilyticus]